MKKLCCIPALAATGVLYLLFTGCASLSGLQDGRTVGENNGEFSASLNFSQSPDYVEWESRADTAGEIPNLFIVTGELGGRYGVSENVDITLRMNTMFNLGLGAKVQVLGDRESPTALSVGAEIGSFALWLGLWNFQLPVYFSVHPSDNFAWYCSPRYIYQFASYAGAEAGVTYFGGNTGLLFGRRHKFGLDLGYYRISSFGESIGALQFGLGGRFVFGKN